MMADHDNIKNVDCLRGSWEISHDVENFFNIGACFLSSIQLIQLHACIFTTIQVIYLSKMSYNNVTDFIAALKAMDARIRAAISTDALEQFITSAEGELVRRS